MSDGTPTLPGPTGNLATLLSGGFGGRYNLDALNDFLFKKFEDGFYGDVLTTLYPAAKTNGASAAVTFTAGNDQGWLDLITGTDNDGYAGQAMTDVLHTGDRGLLAEFLIETPASLANYKLEVGVADAPDASGMVNSKSAATATGTDFAVLCFDTAHNSALDLIHAKAGTVARVTGDLTLAVSSLYYVSCRVVGDDVMFEIQGLAGTSHSKVTYANATAAAGIEGGTDITPWVFTQTRAGSASKTTKLMKWRSVWPAY